MTASSILGLGFQFGGFDFLQRRFGLLRVGSLAGVLLGAAYLMLTLVGDGRDAATVAGAEARGAGGGDGASSGGHEGGGAAGEAETERVATPLAIGIVCCVTLLQGAGIAMSMAVPSPLLAQVRAVRCEKTRSGER